MTETVNVPYLYMETLTLINRTEERLLDSPNPITRSDLKELGLLHRKAANYRESIFKSWNRAEKPKTSFFKKLFWI
jgi:hypothetical protein